MRSILIIALALITTNVNAATAYLVRQTYDGGRYLYCEYVYLGERLVYTVPWTSSCPLTIQIPDPF